MLIEDTTLPGVKLITPEVFRDHRGWYVETYNDAEFFGQGISIAFVQDDSSVSTGDVLRGIHGDERTWKLVSCAYGAMFLVVVNRETRKWQGWDLSGNAYRQVLVPPGHGVGHLVTSTSPAVFSYKQSTYYDRDSQWTIRWDDPRYGIKWPLASGVKPVLSERDANAA